MIAHRHEEHEVLVIQELLPDIPQPLHRQIHGWSTSTHKQNNTKSKYTDFSFVASVKHTRETLRMIIITAPYNGNLKLFLCANRLFWFLVCNKHLTWTGWWASRSRSSRHGRSLALTVGMWEYWDTVSWTSLLGYGVGFGVGSPLGLGARS